MEISRDLTESRQVKDFNTLLQMNFLLSTEFHAFTTKDSGKRM